MVDNSYLGYIKCIGCGRGGAISLCNFPDDYPRNFMLCCACTTSYYGHLGISPPPNILSCYGVGFRMGWWEIHGKSIEKAMRLQ